ncbi:MAG TPA: benzoylformate decarboxylase [Candidatus Acidoferrales bacterium]|nr:benzoylformate decarboxylase [Candidatus Acidoferrales bacterium]
MPTVREATYDLLRRLGMTVIFGNPGSTELPFLRDMPSDFRYILGLHERVAAGMALGYSLGTHRPVFVNLHSIASSGNGLSTLVDAWYGHVPLVVTTGQADRRHILAEPFLVSRAAETVKPYVKWSCEPARAEDVPAAIAHAYHLASQPPQGPVFLSIPMDDWTHSCQPVEPRSVHAAALPHLAALDDVVRALDACSNPALVAGPQIEEDSAWQETIALAERLNAHVYSSPIAPRWTFPRTHRLFRGGLVPAQQPLADQLAPYDTVVVLGAQVFLYYAYVPGHPVRPGTRLFQITNSPQQAASALAGTSIVGNIAAAARYLSERIKPRTSASPSPREVPNEVPPDPPASHPITPAFLFSFLNKLKPHDAIICEECPSSKGDLDRYLTTDQPRSFYSVPNGVLGFGLPAAVGLQLANPGRRVICPVGDGSIQYSIQALWSAAQLRLPVLFIVLRNGDYSALKSFCDFTGVGRNVHGMDLPGIDIVKIAQGYGLSASEVDRPEDLEPALRRALSSSAPSLLSVNILPGSPRTMGMDRSVHPPIYS